MFELKGKYLTSRFYARRIPMLSRYVYEMSFVEKSSFFYKTIPFPTRLIHLQEDFEHGHSNRLRKYFRQANKLGFIIERPTSIPHLQDMYQQVVDYKKLNPLLIHTLKTGPDYHYSTIHHPDLGQLAAHLNITDQVEKRVFGYVNASSFRSFTDKATRQICGTANKYLYHQDMLHFKSLSYQYFDLVGTKEPMNQMKKQFGGEIVMTWSHVPYPIHWLKKLKKVLRK